MRAAQFALTLTIASAAALWPLAPASWTVGASQSPPSTTTLVVTVDEAAVLLAPVSGAPEAGTVQRGDMIESEVTVNGENIDGSPTWHLVTLSREPDLVRGFIHSSQVAEPP